MREPVRTPAESGDFFIAEEHSGAGALVLVLHGEADLHVAPELRDRLAGAIDRGAASLVVDLSHTTFVDSMALGVLVGAMRQLQAGHGQLRLVVPRTEVRRIFEIAHLDRILPLDGTRDEALAAVAPKAETG